MRVPHFSRVLSARSGDFRESKGLSRLAKLEGFLKVYSCSRKPQ